MIIETFNFSSCARFEADKIAFRTAFALKYSLKHLLCGLLAAVSIRISIIIFTRKDIRVYAFYRIVLCYLTMVNAQIDEIGRLQVASNKEIICLQFFQNVLNYLITIMRDAYGLFAIYGLISDETYCKESIWLSATCFLQLMLSFNKSFVSLQLALNRLTVFKLRDAHDRVSWGMSSKNAVALFGLQSLVFVIQIWSQMLPLLTGLTLFLSALVYAEYPSAQPSMITLCITSGINETIADSWQSFFRLRV